MPKKNAIKIETHNALSLTTLHVGNGAALAIEKAVWELKSAQDKFPTWPTDALHAFAVLGEEVGELQKAVLQHTYERTKSTRRDVEKEAQQVAAMAVRFLANIDRYTFSPCKQLDDTE